MTTFLDGPAQGESLMLRRSPFFLRVVEGPGDELDALDQLSDGPKPQEVVTVYHLAREPGHCHIRSAKRGASGFFAVAEYRMLPRQPSADDVRTADRWSQWVEEHRRFAEDQMMEWKRL